MCVGTAATCESLGESTVQGRVTVDLYYWGEYNGGESVIAHARARFGNAIEHAEQAALGTDQ